MHQPVQNLRGQDILDTLRGVHEGVSQVEKSS